ncbi:amidohydrolase [Anaerolineales bacterium HSG25]|nr:amidohydrolase [Anaerolineales bacterium HSG25]
MENLTLTIVQSHLHWHNPSKNRAMFEQILTGLNQPTDLVILPEMFSTGFTMQPETCAEPMSGSTVAWMRDMAAQHNIVLTGSLVIEADGQHFNRLIWMPPDGQFVSYDKRHLFRMANEHDHYQDGQSRLITELKGWRICPLICYDLRFPVWSRNHPQVYDLLIYVANWPAKRRSAWQALLKARAIENLAYVVGVNRVGEDGNGIAYNGDSVALTYLGEEIVSGAYQPLLTNVTLNYEVLTQYRASFPAYLDADSFEIGS